MNAEFAEERRGKTSAIRRSQRAAAASAFNFNFALPCDSHL